jgi:hypothetical protein
VVNHQDNNDLFGDKPVKNGVNQNLKIRTTKRTSLGKYLATKLIKSMMSNTCKGFMSSLASKLFLTTKVDKIASCRHSNIIVCLLETKVNKHL